MATTPGGSSARVRHSALTAAAWAAVGISPVSRSQNRPSGMGWPPGTAVGSFCCGVSGQRISRRLVSTHRHAVPTCLALFNGIAPEADAFLRVQEAGFPVQPGNAPHAAQRLVHRHAAQGLGAMRLLERLELVLCAVWWWWDKVNESDSGQRPTTTATSHTCSPGSSSAKRAFRSVPPDSHLATPAPAWCHACEEGNQHESGVGRVARTRDTQRGHAPCVALPRVSARTAWWRRCAWRRGTGVST